MTTRGATRSSKTKLVNLSQYSGIFKKLSKGVVVLALIAGLLFGSLEAVNQDIEKIELNAPLVQISEGELRKVLVTALPASFLYIDINGIENSLNELPMVRSATVKKHWPDTLIVDVIEETPVARWNQQQLLGHEGQVLKVANGDNSQLPVLNGPDGQSTIVMEHYYLFSSWAKRHQFELTSINKTAYSWVLDLNSGYTLLLDPENPLLSLQRLEKILSQVELKNADNIDLRYEQGISIAWKSPSATQKEKEKNI